MTEKKEALRNVNLNQNRMQEKLGYSQNTIGGSNETLKEFDDELFKALVEKGLV